jgi:hypothetical protein
VPKRKRTSKAGGKRAGHGGGDRVSPAEAASDRHRIRIAEALFALTWDLALDHKDKLYALKMGLRNLRPALEMLLNQAADQTHARSEVALSLAEIIVQLLETLVDLLRLERASPTPTNPIGLHHRSTKSTPPRPRCWLKRGKLRAKPPVNPRIRQTDLK